jgi:hypothetical protein
MGFVDYVLRLVTQTIVLPIPFGHLRPTESVCDRSGRMVENGLLERNGEEVEHRTAGVDSVQTAQHRSVAAGVEDALEDDVTAAIEGKSRTLASHLGRQRMRRDAVLVEDNGPNVVLLDPDQTLRMPATKRKCGRAFLPYREFRRSTISRGFRSSSSAAAGPGDLDQGVATTHKQPQLIGGRQPSAPRRRSCDVSRRPFLHPRPRSVRGRRRVPPCTGTSRPGRAPRR